MKPTRRILLQFLFILTLAVALLFARCSSDEINENDITSISNYGIVQDSTDFQLIFDDSAAYAFINELNLIIGNNVLSREISNWSSKGVNFGKKDTTSDSFNFYVRPDFFIVDEKDSAYLKSQIEFADEQIWNLSLLGQDSVWAAYNNWTLENPEFDWDKFKDSGFGCFVDLGVPLFNKAHDVAIIYVSYQCHYLMGSGSIHKYEKVDGKWELKEKAQLWIS